MWADGNTLYNVFLCAVIPTYSADFIRTFLLTFENYLYKNIKILGVIPNYLCSDNTSDACSELFMHLTQQRFFSFADYTDVPQNVVY
jgi:hypothetical protein